MEDPTVLEIDLKPYYIKVRNYWRRDKNDLINAIPADAKIGKQAAKDCDLNNRWPHLLKIRIITIHDIYCEHPQDSFWKGFLGPLARKHGVQHVRQLIEAEQNVMWHINRYLDEEGMRIEAKARKKAKEKAMADPSAWSEPVQFFVPDIGTTIKLNFDWEFVLYQERRNYGFIDLFGLFNGRVYQDWRTRTDPETATVTVRAGSELQIDRIYIRKGAEDYSSITFWLGKGAVVIGPDGTQHAPKKRIRFWAKLADVNKIQALINKASVPGMT